MPKGNDDDSQGLGMCKRLINIIINNFTQRQRYKRLPLNSSSDSPKSNGGQEVVIDFRHIDVPPENSNSQSQSQSQSQQYYSGGTHIGGGAVKRSQQATGINRQEIKVKSGGIQGNGTRLTVKVEEGGRGTEKGRNRVGNEETALKKADEELRKLPFIIDQKAEEFLRSRKEAMIRKYSPQNY